MSGTKLYHPRWDLRNHPLAQVAIQEMNKSFDVSCIVTAVDRDLHRHGTLHSGMSQDAELPPALVITKPVPRGTTEKHNDVQRMISKALQSMQQLAAETVTSDNYTAVSQVLRATEAFLQGSLKKLPTARAVAHASPTIQSPFQKPSPNKSLLRKRKCKTVEMVSCSLKSKRVRFDEDEKDKSEEGL